MSSDRIRHFDSITKEDVPYVGGKGANLGEMSRAGFPVPEGFVITAQSYREFATENGITSQSDHIREKILQGTIPEALKNEILAAYRQLAAEESHSLTGARVAVRSSATAEDLPDASMFLQNTGKFFEALLVSVLRQGIFYVPLLYVLPALFGLDGFLLLQPLADLLSAAIGIWFLLRALRLMPAR